MPDYYALQNLLDRAEALLALEIDALASCKSVQGVVDDFTTRLSDFAVQAFYGRMDKVDFQRALRALLKQDATDVYIEGMIEGGYENEAEARAEMDDDDRAEIAKWYVEQSGFVNAFAQAVVATRQAPDKTTEQQAILTASSCGGRAWRPWASWAGQADRKPRWANGSTAILSTAIPAGRSTGKSTA